MPLEGCEPGDAPAMDQQIVSVPQLERPVRRCVSIRNRPLSIGDPFQLGLSYVLTHPGLGTLLCPETDTSGRTVCVRGAPSGARPIRGFNRECRL